MYCATWPLLIQKSDTASPLIFLLLLCLIVLRDEHVALRATRQLLVKLGTRTWYTDGMRQLRADTLVMDDLIKDKLPRLHEVFRIHKFDLLLVCSKWFLCLFATVLEGDALVRVWDVILCDGIEAVFRIAVALFAQYAEQACRATSVDDLIFLFQDARSEAKPEALIRSAYDPVSIGSISRADLAQRRQQAVKKVSSDDTRAEMRNHQYWRGGVRPASILNRA